MINFFKIAVLLGAASILSACATQQPTAQVVLKPVIQYQCHQQLNDSKLWKATSLLMSTTKRQDMQNQACACVGEHALDNVPASQIAHAMVNEEAKNQLIKKAVMNSLRACILDIQS